ncbi:FitA-like ribbon-helix-helix domain-containing protein [Nocardia fusca]
MTVRHLSDEVHRAIRQRAATAAAPRPRYVGELHTGSGVT